MHINTKSLQSLGHWLYRKWYQCQVRMAKALGELEEANIEEEVLRVEWAAQVQEQTKPAISL